jgi:formate dehydrogenase gamma subunit
MRHWRWLAIIGFLVIAAPVLAQDPGKVDCAGCHNDSSLTKDVNGKQVSVFVDQKVFQSSVHSGLDCASCHSDVKDYPHDPAPKAVSCAECHEDAVQAYGRGMHSKARSGGNAKAANCVDCHGSPHAIVSSSDPKSKVYRTNIAQTCGSCHSLQFVMEGSGLSTQPFFSYQESVHGRAVAAGSMKAAVCTDCHHSHNTQSAAEPDSSIYKSNVPATCGQCHKAVTDEFNQSIHGQALKRGKSQAPSCTDCHGIHSIKSHIDPNSSVAAQALARTTCAKCHEGVRLSEEYGISGGRTSTYLDSYHGLASRLGSKVIANCASCHGIHNILPSSDPRSTISKANLVATCGKCHPGSNTNFVQGRIHMDKPISEDIGSIVNDWARRIYIWLIVIVIGGMVGHNVLLWRKKAVAARKSQERTIERLTGNQRFQHWCMMITFIILALTGFALKYPDSWLAWLLGSNETFRRTVHRIAGTIMVIVGVYHVFYAAAFKEGRQFIKGLLPVKKDIYDAIHNVAHILGLRSDHPKFHKFTYAEKAEYWALVWGVFVMGLTGFMAWFEVEMAQLMPRWVVDVAITIHFYEAVLATLAIIVWHLYGVIFDPDAYPLNWAFWDGKISNELYRKEHTLHHKELMEQEEKGRKPTS